MTTLCSICKTASSTVRMYDFEATYLCGSCYREENLREYEDFIAPLKKGDRKLYITKLEAYRMIAMALFQWMEPDMKCHCGWTAVVGCSCYSIERGQRVDRPVFEDPSVPFKDTTTYANFDL